MARITLTDLSCMLDGCRYHLARSSHHQSFVRAHERLPWAWILARETLLNVDCTIVPTDQSHPLEGHISMCHILNGSPRLASSFPSAALPSLTRNGFTQLSHFGSWSAQNTASPFRFEPAHDLTTELSAAAPSLRRHLPSLISWLRHLCLSTLLNGSCDETLTIARPLRHLHAEEKIIALSSLHTAPTNSFSPLLPRTHQCSHHQHHFSRAGQLRLQQRHPIARW
ncbi:hypothetical protein C8R48DRAFT_278977 [Suillus tomentosus]|nr:hypothetical protein C8R48DRAFT_278977 [Suillus tomentosus]